jgi:plasmid stabilization system protein ParE
VKRYAVRLMPAAENDLRAIYRYILMASSSAPVARAYVARIRRFLEGFQSFPMRGSLRSEVRDGLRIVGFERTASIAFLVETDEVIILRITSHGQQLEL